MKKTKSNLIVAIVCLLLICLTVGYAAINSKLNINGTTDISSNKWIIYFDNVVENETSIQAIKTATIEEDKTKMNFDIELTEPGEYYEFNVDVVNDGTIDAMIDQVIKDGMLPSHEEYLTFDVTYDDGTPLKRCDALNAESKRNLLVKVTFKEEVTEDQLPEVNQILDLGFEIDYIQKDGTCETEDIETTPAPTAYTLTIDPNGGTYNGTTNKTQVTMKTGATYNLLSVTKEDDEFVGWTMDIPAVLNETTVTMGTKNIVLKANWNSDKVAKINETTYPTIQRAINAAVTGDTIELLKSTT